MYYLTLSLNLVCIIGIIGGLYFSPKEQKGKQGNGTFSTEETDTHYAKMYIICITSEKSRKCFTIMPYFL